MINIAICEADIPERRRLIALISRYQSENALEITYEVYINGKVLVSNFYNQYDIIFISAELEEYSEIKIAECIRKSDTSAAIIYMAHQTTSIVDSYNVDAADYIIKPMSYHLLKRALRKAFIFMRQKKYNILINDKNRIFELSLYEVLYIEYELRALKFFKVEGEVIECKGTLKSVLERDQEGLLFKINKYQLVNRIWVDHCEEGKVYIKNIKRNLFASREQWRNLKAIYTKSERDAVSVFNESK